MSTSAKHEFDGMMAVFDGLLKRTTGSQDVDGQQLGKEAATYETDSTNKPSPDGSHLFING